MSLIWLDRYKIGDAEIDRQHQVLFQLANQFLAAQDRSSRIACSMTLFRHTQEHFEHEEGLMRRIAYPHIGAHFKEHSALLSKVNGFSVQIAADTLNNAELEAFLADWLVRHMVTSDTQLAAHLGLLVEELRVDIRKHIRPPKGLPDDRGNH